MKNSVAVSAILAAAIGRLVSDGVNTLAIDALLDKQGTLKSGESAPYIHLAGVAGSGPVEVALHPQKAKELLAKGECGVYRLLADVVIPPAKKAAKKVKAVEEDVKESKKAAAIRIFNKLNVDGKQRKEIIAQLVAELGMNAPGAGTYYQNVKSGTWA